HHQHLHSFPTRRSSDLRNLQLLEPLTRHGETDQTPPMSGHEINRLRCDLFGGNHEVAFIFTILIIDDDDQTSFLDFRDGFFNRCELHTASTNFLCILPGHRIPGSPDHSVWLSSGSYSRTCEELLPPKKR